MKLTIFGSTGGTGQQLVTQACKQGHEVTAFVRNPGKFDKKHERIQVVKGDVEDFDSVKQTIKGQDAVLCALGLPPMNKNRLRANGAKNILRAMEETGVKRFVCQSALGVGDSREILPFQYKYFIVPLMLRNVYADHELQEKYIKKSKLDWVIIRPAVLTNTKHTGIYQHGFTASERTIALKISRADVADFMLKQITDDTYLHKTPSISY